MVFRGFQAPAAEQGARRPWFLFGRYSFWFSALVVGMDVFCLLLDCLFFWFAFGCVWLLFLCVLFLVSFRFALLPVASAYLFLLPFPLVLHGEGKYLMVHNGTSDIPSSVECSGPKNGMRHE